jgi:acetolactate synthase-1/2/3 large subunit
MASVSSRPEADAAGSDTQTLTGGQALVASLKANGVDTIFGLPGIQLDGFFGALWEERENIRVIHPRHEQTTGYMADGYARVTGREGVATVVPGPGLLNATAALATAYACNSPVLMVTGQIRSDLIGVGRGALHEIPNQLEMIRSVTKHASRPMKPGDVPGAIEEAFTQLRTGRPRPVEVEIPPDTLFAKAEFAPAVAVAERQRFAGDPDLIEQAAKLLGKAKRTVIVAGGGFQRSNASEELLELAEALQAPVIVSANGKGAISDRLPYAQGVLARTEYLPNADVIVLLGTRFIEAGEVVYIPSCDQDVIQLDIDPEEIGRNIPVRVGIEADLKAGLTALIDRLQRHNIKRESRVDEFTRFQAGASARINAIEPQAGFALAIRAEVPDEGIIVGEFTQVSYWSFLGMPTYAPNTYITPGYQGTLGFGFTTAMGAKVGRPDVPVVSINGDGGFGYSLSELSTLVQHNIPLVAIVFNDNAYGNVRRIQDEDYGGRILASELVNPNYQQLARAFGVADRRAETAAQLQIQVREAIKANEPTLIEVPVGVMKDARVELGLSR